MVGGTIFHRRVIQREISRVLVLNLSGKAGGAGAPPRTTMPLTEDSLLSMGHPTFVNYLCETVANFFSGRKYRAGIRTKIKYEA
jgi:hypothetical protein